jgi:RHH-type proline utilization regulon transcriptional repressor/proline dehydrogenase/delta 1-pyrroline-5-carboxylate dehydrogenase
VIDWLVDLGQRSGHRFMLRLVKGAYWDTEIKRAQVDGVSGYPVYTRKTHTDISYLACARKMLLAAHAIYPQFATHNAHTLATVNAWAEEYGITDYEFQCLYGMGEVLYDQIVGPNGLSCPCRIYAPVGSHETLLPYLVRRLLENGANTSFVNRVVDDKVSIDELVADPFVKVSQWQGLPHPKIPLPINLFGNERKNSSGIDWNDEKVLREAPEILIKEITKSWHATPLLKSNFHSVIRKPIANPADGEDIVGEVIEADDIDIQAALEAASTELPGWEKLSSSTRASILNRASELLETNQLELISLMVREAGKTLANACGEVREAVDFLRYYAQQAQFDLKAEPLGIVACISPWNFPLSIFVGQISAALAAGNCVLAKPAEQTPLIAYRAVQLLHEAGVPHAALQLLPGNGETVGASLVADPKINGVLFTGSTEVARTINRVLSSRSSSGLPVLIAETGGQNAMIVDSSALPEQVVQDVMVSAFDSAGQRCSALRILCLQNEIAEQVLRMLEGALSEWRIGRPDRLDTDVGPVIDKNAYAALVTHIEGMRKKARRFFQTSLSADTAKGYFIPPTIIEIDSPRLLTREVFGPVLHVVRFKRDDLPNLLEEINATGYGLTLGIHSRINESISTIVSQMRVGNVYINRSMIGAVVGVQPFGGEGLSGTGPKAGGPLYLPRLSRNADFVLPAIPGSETKNPDLDELVSWASTQGYEEITCLARQYREASLSKRTFSLPGPVGEENTLSFVSRGRVLCLAATLEGMLNQFAAVLATQNKIYLPLSSKRNIPSSFPATLSEKVCWLESSAQIKASVDCVLAEKPVAGEVFSKLAQCDGPIMTIIETSNKETIPIERLVIERVLSVNTAAAGGNANLMSHDFQ